MNALLIYDSRFGNTEKIARAIAEGLTGARAHVEVRRAVEVRPDRLAGRDLVLVGGPTHGTQPSQPTVEFLRRLPDGALRGIKVATFDTRTDPEDQKGIIRVLARVFDHFGYAAPKIAAALEKKAGQVIAPPEGFIVLDTEGPLREGELARAKKWGAQVVTAARG